MWVRPFCYGQRPKTGIPGPFGAKNRYILKSQVKSAPYERCHWSKAHCTCFWPDKAQVQPSFSTLLDVQLFFVVFQPIKEALCSSTLCPPYECQRTGRPIHPPHPTPRYSSTHVSAYTPPPRYRDTTCGYQFTPWSLTAVRELHPKSRKAPSILRCRSLARRPRSRQIHVLLLVWRVVGCGGWRGPLRTSAFV